MEKPVGIVVCGGLSTRMGRDKSLISYHGTAQRYWLYKLLEPFCKRVIISCNSLQSKDIEAGYDYIIDSEKYRDNGPMTALLTAFESYPDNAFIVVGCDYPFIKPEDIVQLISARNKTDAAISFFNKAANLYEPLLAVYENSIAGSIFEAFNRKRFSLQNILYDSGARKIFPRDTKTIQSIDTMKEYLKVIMPRRSATAVPATKINDSSIVTTNDMVATEEPLEIRVGKPISITMRTPGNDEELATGFLFTEGIITSAAEIDILPKIDGADEHVIEVTLKPGVTIDRDKLERHFYTTSSCGVCGKTSIDAIKTVCRLAETKNEKQYPAALIQQLPGKLRSGQMVFEQTGGLHASALFTGDGSLVLLREDVGRHNALDKLVGAALLADMLPLNDHILLLSGRISFELVQKAAMAGIKMITAIGAPSSLAVETAGSFDMTLIGFLKDDRFNIYSGAQRIVI